MPEITGDRTLIQLLGQVAIETPSCRHSNLPAQFRKVLALLAATRDVPLSAEQIVKRVWDGDAPRTAVQMVRNHINTLRRLLGPPAGEAVQRSQSGYRLSGTGVDIDAERFGSSVRRARSLRADHRWAEAVRTLDEGMRLWHGPEALVDVRDVPDLEIEALRLEELRFAAEEMLVEAYLALGQPEDALPRLQAMTTLHPVRELPWLQLMAAQTLIGRRIEASVDTYRRAQLHLVENTGLDAPLLAEVHRSLLRGITGPDLIAMITRESSRSRRAW